MKINDTNINGCYIINPDIHHDQRGMFIKTFIKEEFLLKNLKINFSEEFYTVSKKRVLRGLHFQTPPFLLSKIVYCIYGKIFDVIVDLRTGSPDYGKHEIFELSAENKNMLYIAEGIAHGFYVLSKTAITVYKTTARYSPENDCGILWSSINIPWCDKNPVISQRDKDLIRFENFTSPFNFHQE